MNAIDDQSAMREAIALAAAAAQIGETPVGCLVVNVAGSIIGRGHNRRQIDADPTAHAEILALRDAARSRGDWRLSDCTLVVTLEPCPMCAGALLNARVARLVYGATDPKAGAVRTLFQLCDDPRLNHRVEIVAGVLAEECGELLRKFFQAQRALGKK
ncbi:MAG: tRNA adenosine(34) deaminase TadA [Tepidisphaeraceae bacterium]